MRIGFTLNNYEEMKMKLKLDESSNCLGVFFVLSMIFMHHDALWLVKNDAADDNTNR